MCQIRPYELKKVFLQKILAYFLHHSIKMFMEKLPKSPKSLIFIVLRMILKKKLENILNLCFV